MLKTVSSITNAIGALNYKGTWDASTNTPTLVSSVGTKGDYYVVSVAGSTSLDGISNWGIGDWAVFNGAVWQRVEGGADLNGVNLSVSGVATFAAGAVGAPAITTSGDTNTGVYFPAADTIAFTEGGVESMRINSSGNVLVGTTNTPSNKDTVTPKFIVNGAGAAGSMQVVRNTTVGGGGAILELTATRGTDVNSYTILQSGDGIGSVIFGGADGNEFVQAAAIVGAVDGTPGDNDMPGRLVFSTTADGASSPTERMRIANDGIVTMSAYGAGAATFSAAGVISSVSDETWKIKDGVPVDPDSMLKKLEPGYWYYNDEKKETFGVDRQLGFYAQNVNAAIGAEAAPTPEEGKPWGYYDRSVLAVTVLSLQKALATIDFLNKRIEVLEAK